ncbi:hypothetical protein HNY73_000082 [Argiope bruennichi]|uniref:Uncharacterized protein n=1 Tax=Argiope bruennichi TaxID=94029 RepID=A0A8T0FWU0_ARGBR|nr:hypothetical protein HNY73_000082 [Argiope bruennichi]
MNLFRIEIARRGERKRFEKGRKSRTGDRKFGGKDPRELERRFESSEFEFAKFETKNERERIEKKTNGTDDFDSKNDRTKRVRGVVSNEALRDDERRETRGESSTETRGRRAVKKKNRFERTRFDEKKTEGKVVYDRFFENEKESRSKEKAEKTKGRSRKTTTSGRKGRGKKRTVDDESARRRREKNRRNDENREGRFGARSTTTTKSRETRVAERRDESKRTTKKRKKKFDSNSIRELERGFVFSPRSRSFEDANSTFRGRGSPEETKEKRGRKTDAERIDERRKKRFGESKTESTFETRFRFDVPTRRSIRREANGEIERKEGPFGKKPARPTRIRFDSKRKKTIP